MASLQSRLAGLEPSPAPRAWVENLKSMFRPRVLPVWGAAAAMLALVVLIPRGGSESGPARGVIPVESAAALRASHQNVAISASDPFADIGSANLAAHLPADSGGDDETVF
jgi:hypothetical protein